MPHAHNSFSVLDGWTGGGDRYSFTCIKSVLTGMGINKVCGTRNGKDAAKQELLWSSGQSTDLCNHLALGVKSRLGVPFGLPPPPAFDKASEELLGRGQHRLLPPTLLGRWPLKEPDC